MIDPSKITKFDCNDYELQEVLLFWVCAAGKNAKNAARGLEAVLQLLITKRWNTPFEAIRTLKGRSSVQLSEILRTNGIGCYNHKAKTFWQLANSNLDLRTCTVADLEEIHGIGPKTARCFIIHSRANAECAGLDTHILHYMRDLGYDVPKTTPTGKRYLAIESEFLKLAKRSGLSVAEFDLLIWNVYSGKNKSAEATSFLRSLKMEYCLQFGLDKSSLEAADEIRPKRAKSRSTTKIPRNRQAYAY